MKALFLIFLFGTFLFSSCKKDRTCNCYTDVNGTFPYGWQSPKPYNATVKATKRGADEKCASLGSEQGTPGEDWLQTVCSYSGN